MAADFAPVLSSQVPRDPQDWPQVVPRPVPAYQGVIPAPDKALRGMARAGLQACIALCEHRGKASPQLKADDDISRANAIALLDDLTGDVFLRLRGG